MMNQTNWKLYTDNPSAWGAMIEACEEATATIDLENFIFEQDAVGKRFIEVCSRKAEEGVKVRFLWDAAGSFSFAGASIIKDLAKKGIKLAYFKTFFPSLFTSYKYRSWYFRNHRRSLVIDGKVGFTGSVSITTRVENWRDTSIRVEGPVVQDMKYLFDKMWTRSNGKRLGKGNGQSRIDYDFEYIATMPFPGRRALNKRIVEAVRNARKHVYITVPYFVPTHRLSRVLYLAAHRGVDVRILLPQHSDFPIVDLGARTFFHYFLKGGIRIFLYKNRMMHTKSIVIDGDWATLGTLNLDSISLLYNFEANIVSSNSYFVSELTSHFQEDIENAEEVTLEQWDRRSTIEKVSTFFVKFIRSFL